MTQLSAELTNESKRYASRAQDLYRQVCRGRPLLAFAPNKLESLVMEDDISEINVLAGAHAKIHAHSCNLRSGCFLHLYSLCLLSLVNVQLDRSKASLYMYSLLGQASA